MGPNVPKPKAADSKSDAPPGQAKRRRLKRRSTEETVERMLQERFQGFTKAQTEIMEKDGKTLRQRLLEEVRSKRKAGNSRPATQAFVTEMRELYASEQCPTKTLLVTDPDEVVRESLQQAMLLAHHVNPAKRSKNGLYSFLSSVQTLNQKETVGILKSLGQLASLISPSHRAHVLQCMKFLVQKGITQTFEKECGMLREMWDQCLAMTYVAFKKDKTVHDFWACYQDQCSMVLDTDEVEKLLKEQGPWTNSRASLFNVVNSGMLGAKMFGAAAGEILRDDFSSYVDAKITLQKQSDAKLTKKIVDDMKADFLRKADTMKDISNGATLAGQRQVAVTYRGVQAQVPVCDHIEEIDMKLSAPVKEYAVGRAGGLTPLVWEAACFGHPEGEVKVDQDLPGLREYESARKAANDVCKASKANGHEISEVLSSRLQFFRQLDRTFTLEILMLKHMCDHGAQQRLFAIILEAMPSAERKRTIEQVVADVVALQASDLYNFASLSVRGVVEGARELLSTMERGETVEVRNIPAKGFMRDLLGRTAFFARFSLAASSGSTPTTIFGKDALKELVKEMDDGESEKILLEQLKVPQMLSHMLSPEQRAVVERLTDETVMRAMGMPASDESQGQQLKRGKTATSDFNETEKKKKSKKAEGGIKAEKAVQDMVTGWFS